MRVEAYPRPNAAELPGLYAELDRLVRKAEEVLRSLPERLFKRDTETIQFQEMREPDLQTIVARDPSVMVIAFTRVCGLSDREFDRVYGLHNVYRLRDRWNTDHDGRQTFTRVILQLLRQPMHLETFLYTFYKMWEEHQKRHYRARYEVDVRKFFKEQGYDIEKLRRPTEVNGAIPPRNPQVVMQIRTGVRKDLVKRAKEFSAEMDESLKFFPNARFLVVYKIPPHELHRRDEIRQVIIDHRKGKRPYDGVFLQDELEHALQALRAWKVPRTGAVSLA